MKNDILLVDPNAFSNEGHHAYYRDALLELDGTKFYNKPCKFISPFKNIFKAFFGRKKYLMDVPSSNKLVLLYFDSIYFFPSLLKKIRKKHNKIYCVLHWTPKNKLKTFLLKRCSKYVDLIVVHSEYLLNILKQHNIINVTSIDYPSFCPINQIENTQNNGKYKLLLIGGTRYDKGLDIFINSFKFLSQETIDKISVTVAGEECDIKYSFLIEEAKKYSIELRTYPYILSTSEYWNLINESSAILLPYRKIFSGCSGPMTDGAFKKKTIIGPDYGNIGFLINKNCLGLTFECENCVSLANSINNYVKNDFNVQSDYYKTLNVATFLEKYSDLLKKD